MAKDLEQLRQRAESAIMRRSVEPEKIRDRDVATLVHELEVHQVELEMQNEELRAAQTALTESRDRYYELYDLAPVGYLTLDRSGKIYEANLAAASLLGVEQPRLLGRALSSFLEEGDADTLYRHLGEVFEGDVKIGCDLSLGSHDGPKARAKPVHIDSISFADPDGQRARCRSVLIDLSDLREAQEAERSYKAQDKTLLDTATDAIISSDGAGRILSFNAAAERLFGHEQSEVMGKSVRMLMPAPYREEHDQYIHRYVSTGEARIIGRSNRELVGRRKNGSTFPLILGLGEWYERGERRFTAIIHDITDRKRDEEALRRSEERFREVAEVIEDVIYVVESDHTISYVSPAYGRVWGRESSETTLSRAGWLDYVHPADAARVATAHECALRGDPFDEEYRFFRPNGDVRWVRDRLFPVEGTDGAILRQIGIAQDITESRALEEELAQAQRMEAVGTLASRIAHDFRNLLQGIGGCAQMALRSSDLERARSYLGQIADTTRSGAALIDQLMTFSRRQSIRSQPTPIDEVVERTAPLIERIVGEHIEVTAETRASGAVILAGAGQVEQILLNVAANAADAMPTGGSLRIRTEVLAMDEREALGLTGPGRFVRVLVEDTGVGMDEQTRLHIFEPFFTTKELGKGTGLGLSSVSGLVTKLRGHVTVESEVGRGTRFVFYFPLYEPTSLRLSSDVESAARREKRPRSRATSGVSAAPRTATILVVEDSEPSRLALRDLFAGLGHTVIATARPSAALEAAKHSHAPIDLLLTDLQLPEMDGEELARRLGETQAGLQVILMSGLAGQSHRTKAAFLQKPFDLDILEAMVQRMLTAGEMSEEQRPAGPGPTR